MGDTELLAASHDGIVAIRVRGRGTFKISRDFRLYGEKVLAEGASGLIVDLAECQGLDSTFMGVMAMLGLKALDRAALVIVNAAPHLRELLEVIGVARLWRFSETPAPDGQWTTICRAAAEALAVEGAVQTVLSAHRTLMDLDPENIPRFDVLVKMLVEELGEKDKGKGSLTCSPTE